MVSHHILFIVLIGVVYFIGYFRGSWHMMKCKEGRCTVPFCKNNPKYANR